MPRKKEAAIQPKVGFVSLGCPKALVDSEQILTRLRAEGYDIVPDYEGADLVVVNTCGFIDAAVAESLDAIGEALTENGRVIVTGCLGAKEDVVLAAHPQVLAVTGPHATEQVMQEVHRHLPKPHDPFEDLVPPQGIKLTPRHYAYLKISEGCNHRCTFCIIPSMRGDLVSRPISDVMREAENLVAAGVKELLVISQDTGAYGVDVRYAPSSFGDREVRTKFIDLARELGSLGVWTRLHYVYPYPHVDDVLELMADGKILPYLDIPFQHASPRVLRAMKRPGDHETMLERIRRWRRAVPDLAIRSTFIVGFPGETEEDFRQLLDFLSEAKIDRVGAFEYEAVSGAPANDLGLEPVAPDVKKARWNRLMEAQQKVSARISREKVGKRVKAIVDEAGPSVAKGRTMADAPEIDGTIHIASSRRLRPGDIVDVRVEAADAYDLRGRAA